MKNNKEIENWFDKVYDVKYPRWEELPDFGLYMDQVITLLERYLNYLIKDHYDRPFTPTMINNYVKLKMIPKPIKKQYNRVHLAYLIVIMSLKQVLTISEIKEGILYQEKLSGTKNAYNLFCCSLELSLKQTLGIINNKYPYIETTIIKDNNNLAIDMATRALSSKIIASYISQQQLKEENND